MQAYSAKPIRVLKFAPLRYTCDAQFLSGPIQRLSRLRQLLAQRHFPFAPLHFYTTSVAQGLLCLYGREYDPP